MRNEKMGGAEYLINNEKGSIPIGDLPIGARVVEPGWVWEFRTGRGYTREEADQVKPVTWIVVARDHYDLDEGHVTLLSEELIGLFAFDNSTDRGHQYAEFGYQHWGESGTRDAKHGLRPWLNSTGIHSDEGFYRAFSESFKQNVLTTTLLNKEGQNGDAYSTQDKVFIPSTTELGDTEHNRTYQIGSAYPYFQGAGDAKRIAGETFWYWTRSPASDFSYECVCGVASYGAFGMGTAVAAEGGVRPALNLKSDTMVSKIRD